MKQEIKERIESINKGIVPAGYKKTPVGICPVEWEDFYLKDLYDFYGGLGIPREKLGNKGIPYLHYGDMHISEKMYVNLDRDIDKLPKYDKIVAEDKMLLNGDIVFVDASEDYEGTCKTFVVYNKNKLPFISGLHTFFGRNKTSLIHIDFQKYLTKIPEIKKQIFKYVQGYKVYGISRENLQKVNINLPSYHEQEKIAEILDCATRQVELQEQLVDKLKVQKKALMQKLLTPQPDWQEVKLGDVVTYASSGGTPKTNFEEYYNGNIVWVSIDDITKCQKYIENSSRKITDLGLKNSSTKLLNPNTILFAMYASIGKCAISKVLCTTSQAILGLVANEKKVGYEYLYYTLCFMEDSLKLLGQKGSQSNLNKQMVLNFNVFLPNLKEQNEITNILKNIDKQIELQQKLLEQYKLRQKALMQLLLTGIVRVD